MKRLSKEKKIQKLENKLEKYKKKLVERSKGYGKVTRTGSGDSYTDQLQDDTNTLTAFIVSIEAELESLRRLK